MKIDSTDLNILKILQQDARAPLSLIAKKTSASRPTIRSRIKRLKDLGIIKKFTVILNRDAIIENIVVILEIGATDADKVSEVLLNKNEILEVYSTLGKGNILCKAVVPNISALKKLVNDIEKIEGINSISSSIVLKTIKEEYEPSVGPEIGVIAECDYCSNKITGDIITYKTHKKDFYFCCPVCLRKFKEKQRL